MAPGRIHLGGIAAAAACVVLAVTGCGGGSSSAPGTAGNSTAAAPAKTTPSAGGKGGSATAPPSGEEKSGKEAGAGKEASPSKGKGESRGKRKHPPLELPSGEPEKGPTKAQQERVPTADIKVTVPGGLTAKNTCKGKNLSPAIAWKNVPPGTAELAIFVMSIKPVEGKLYFDWALAGVDPSLSGLAAGEVPKGAVQGRNGAGENGYSICPESSGKENYIFAVYALPKSLAAKPGFDPLTLRTQATRAAGEVGLGAASFGG